MANLFHDLTEKLTRYWERVWSFGGWLARLLFKIGADLLAPFARWLLLMLSPRSAPRELGRPQIFQPRRGFVVIRARRRAIVSRGYFRNFYKIATA